MPSSAALAVQGMWRESFAAFRDQPRPSLAELRANSAAWPSMTAEPPDVSYEPVSAGGTPAEWVRPAGAATDRVLVYLHGGGFVMGSVATHRYLVGHLTAAIGCVGLSLDYRLAPESPFPAALDDARAALVWLIEEHGVDAGHVMVAGDSSGGSLALGLAVRWRDEGLPPLAGVVALSAWTDLAATGESMRTNADSDPIADPDQGRQNVEMYLGDVDREHPWASPLYANPAGLPPLLLQVGEIEMLRDDSTRMAERAAAAGVDATVEVWPGMHHVFQLSAGHVPEADEAIAAIGTWARPKLGLSAAR